MPLFPGQKASFKATLSADQTGIADAVATKIPFNTEARDIGGFYDNVTNFRWTPPAGIPVCLRAQMLASGTISAGALVIIIIYKNGVAVANSTPTNAIVANSSYQAAAYSDVPNGTDYYEAFAYIDTSSGTGTVNSNASNTVFEGWQIG